MHALVRLLLPLALLVALAGLTGAEEPTAPSSSTHVRDPCAARHLLYSVQRGEGFSLRRDAFVRMSSILLMSRHHTNRTQRGKWTLVLPPLSSRLSPHWHNGLKHPGLAFTERTIPFASLWDMDFLANQTGLRFIEYADWVKQQQSSPKSVPALAGSPPIAAVDQVLHLCSFTYNQAFHEASHLAGKDGRPPVHPGASHPRTHLFREFDCLGGVVPPRDEGYCGTPLPQVSRTGRGLDEHAGTEYGNLALPRGKKASVHCGLANLQPSYTSPIIDEYLSPDVALSAGEGPVCSVLVSNVQLIFWNPAPHHFTPAAAPERISYNARQLFLRSLRLSPPLLALAHAFIRHALLASPAQQLYSPRAAALLASSGDDLSSTVHAAPSLPPYLSFHVRRGDFKFVHKDVVPELDHLALQIVRRFDEAWKTAAAPVGEDTAAAPTQPLSTRIFISSDMDADEFSRLQSYVASLQTSKPRDQIATLVRFDLESVRVSLRNVLSEELNTFLDSGAEAARVPATPESLRESSGVAAGSVTPLTPFHVLLIDQVICEQSRTEQGGFIGTEHSYVSEMVWQQRRALGIESESREVKEVLVGGPLPEGTTMPTPTPAAAQQGPTGSPKKKKSKTKVKKARVTTTTTGKATSRDEL